jgi:hypothetical protein
LTATDLLCIETESMGYWISLLRTPLICQTRIDMLLTVLWRGGSQ